VPYNFDQIPEVNTVEELRSWLTEELKALSQSLNETTELELRPSKHEPVRPREGMIVHADGTNWNPGAGVGTYRYQGGVWNKIADSGNVATTTDVLNGVDTGKFVTPDSLAALWEKGSNVASSGTISLGEGEYFHITGTTTITDIDFAVAKDGRKAILVFDGVLTLTHNATTLILPGGANIVTAAGDACRVVQDAGDNIRVTWYQRATGKALAINGPPTYQYLTTGTGATYTTPAGCTKIHVSMIGGGGGGAAANTNSGAAGGTTTANETVWRLALFGKSSKQPPTGPELSVARNDWHGLPL